MRSQPETALHMLYQLKTLLEKVSGIFNKTTKVTGSLAPLKKIPQSKPNFDKV